MYYYYYYYFIASYLALSETKQGYKATWKMIQCFKSGKHENRQHFLSCYF